MIAWGIGLEMDEERGDGQRRTRIASHSRTTDTSPVNLVIRGREGTLARDTIPEGMSFTVVPMQAEGRGESLGYTCTEWRWRWLSGET